MHTHVAESLEPVWEQAVEDYCQEPGQQWYGDGQDAPEPEQSYTDADYDNNNYYYEHTYDTYMVYAVPSIQLVSDITPAWHTLWQNETSDSNLFVAILDTACQRSVCGKNWLQQRAGPLDIVSMPEHEVFKFGVGQDTSSRRHALAVSLEATSTTADFTVHFSLVAADIPYLWSRQCMQKAGLVLDLAQAHATFTQLPGQPRVELQVVHGHLGVRLHPRQHQLTAPDAQQDLTLHEQAAHETQITSKPTPFMCPACITEEYRSAVRSLLEFKVPKSASRSHIDQSSQAVRSATFGGYTQRGVGVTAITQQHPEIVKSILQIAKSRPADMRMPFLAATITAHISAQHTDANYGLSQTIALGSLSAQSGHLVIDGQHFANLNKWVQFDARQVHYVTPLQPDDRRISLTLYVPRHPGKFSPQNLHQLQELGFPVQAWLATKVWRPAQPLLPPRLAQPVERCTLHLVLQILTSGLASGWCAVCADIATAFLQGEVSSKRPGTLYMSPPDDPLMRES
eukprot:1188571-Amphidinium_carterae.1